MADNHDHKCPGKDFAYVGPDMGDGVWPIVRHTADHRLMIGTATAAKEGQAIDADSSLLRMKHREGNIYDVEPVYEPSRPSESSEGGPAMVNSKAYQSGWDRIFGKQVVGKA